MSRPRRVVVVGAGITGLTAAHRLRASADRSDAIDVTVVEASPRVGGKLRTGEVAGLPVETGPGRVGEGESAGLSGTSEPEHGSSSLDDV